MKYIIILILFSNICFGQLSFDYKGYTYNYATTINSFDTLFLKPYNLYIDKLHCNPDGHLDTVESKVYLDSVIWFYKRHLNYNLMICVQNHFVKGTAKHKFNMGDVNSEEIYNYITSRVGRKDHVFVCGHSRGGLLALNKFRITKKIKSPELTVLICRLAD